MKAATEAKSEGQIWLSYNLEAIAMLAYTEFTSTAVSDLQSEYATPGDDQSTRRTTIGDLWKVRLLHFSAASKRAQLPKAAAALELISK